MKNVHNFLKRTIAKFVYGSQLKWDDTLPLATYCYNTAPSADDLLHFILSMAETHLKEGSAILKIIVYM